MISLFLLFCLYFLVQYIYIARRETSTWTYTHPWNVMSEPKDWVYSLKAGILLVVSHVWFVHVCSLSNGERACVL